MIRQHLKITVDPAEAKGETLHTAITIVAPDAPAISPSPIVWFGWPGGGYNRHYFDLQLPGRVGYSEAEYHVARGSIFVACDHIGIGDSDLPEGAFGHVDTARVNAATAREVIAALREGTLLAELPPLPDLFPVAMGQSYGGLLLTHLQADHPTFEGVAMLGWSGICTDVKTSSGADNVAPPNALREDDLNSGLRHPYRRSFHFDDVPEDIVDEDLRGYPARIGMPVPAWAAVHMPGGPNFAPERGPLGPGVVVEEAARITVPVFIGNGEVDTVPDPRTEPAAYPQSPDITTMVLPRSSHMHNFAGTRAVLWSRLESWARGLQEVKAVAGS
jgi:alpha-beta hydrolase superfamily lysophospholipase